MEKETVSEEKNNPVLDEQMLAKLLEAAYVLQEHNRGLQEMELGLELKRDQLEAEQRSAPSPPKDAPPDAAPGPQADYTVTLAQIVETQHQIQVRHLELENTMLLVAERLTQIARASGAAIGILDGQKLRYRAVAGLLTLPAGTEVPMEKALCAPCLRTGQVFRCADVNPEFLLDTAECLRRGIQSLIAVPIFHDGRVAGGMELYYPTTQAFTEQDVHTGQLMAGLVTEALARGEEVTWKKSLATERAVMLDALEKLKPNLAALVDTPAKNSVARASSAASASTFPCRKCGHQLVGEEQFCGNCGTPRSSDPRSSDYEPPSMQSKVASLWHMQEAMKKTSPGHPADGALTREELPPNRDRVHSAESLADSIEEQAPELFAAPQLPGDHPAESTQFPRTLVNQDFVDSPLPDPETALKAIPGDSVKALETTALAKPEHPAAWSSAASARHFLEQLALAQRPGALARFWNSRRGDIYLAIAVILVAGVIRWGIWSNHSVSATGNPAAAASHRRPDPTADLSLFDRMLISLGLAEAPPAPEYRGNPDTQVWVDLHTALYYCPGTDLYGKTPKGKFTSQRDAQLDQFEPAYRKACD